MEVDFFNGFEVFIEPEAMAEYERCFVQPETIHGIGEDYRASAGIDLTHDKASRTEDRRIECDLLALWQAQCAARVSGLALLDFLR